MADFPVKWFSSNMGGAPVLSDKTPGEMIALMKSCLSTGFNLTPIVEMTYDSATTRVTVKIGSGHGFLPWQVIEVSGADQATYNGEHRVISVGTDWLTFAPDSAPIAGAATGDSLEIKASPSKLWEIIDEDAAGYRMSFRSTAVDATNHVMIMTDDNPTISGTVDSTADAVNVVVAESYEGLDIFEEVLNQWWPASHRYWDTRYEKYNYSKKDWTLITNGKLIYFIIGYGGSSKRSAFVAGNFTTIRPGDAYNFMLSGFRAATGWSSTGYSCYSDFAKSTEPAQDSYRRIARGYNQIPGSVRYSFLKYGLVLGGSIMAPNPADNAFYVSTGRISITEPGISDRGAEVLRGFQPGIVEPLSTLPYYDQKILNDIPGYEGRPIIFVLVSASDDGSYDDADYTKWLNYEESHPYLIAINLDVWE